MPDFEFKTELHLIKSPGLKARNVQELYDGLQVVPVSSVYYHTHRFIQQHHFLSPEPPNDFAYWIDNALALKELAEKVASIDTIKFSELEELRNEISKILFSYLEDKNYPLNDCEKGNEFYFLDCQTFVIPLRRKASNLKEFYEIIKEIDIKSIYFHVFEARIRLKSPENDFQLWLNSIGEHEIVHKLSNLDPYNSTLEALRKKILQIIEERLKL